MKLFALLALSAAPLLTGCGTCGCDPDGPAVDFTKVQDDLSDMYGGTHAGVVEGGELTTNESEADVPCAYSGETFTITYDIGAAEECLGPVGDGPAKSTSCSSAVSARFPVAGTLTIGSDEPITLPGEAMLDSWKDGVRMFENSGVYAPDGDYPYQDMGNTWSSTLIDEAEYGGLYWNRRHSVDGAEILVWETCWFGDSAGR